MAFALTALGALPSYGQPPGPSFVPGSVWDAVFPPEQRPPVTAGAWSPPISIPFGPVHAIVLPTGKVLLFRDSANVGVWDPARNAIDPAPGYELGLEIECSGTLVMPDGRVLVAGGIEFPGELGPFGTAFYDPWKNEWAAGQPMNEGRFYPTTVMLPDRRVLTVAGTNQDNTQATIVETLDLDGIWRPLVGAEAMMTFYPQLFLLGDGRVVRSGPEETAIFLDTTAAEWTEGPARDHEDQSVASVLLPGLKKVLTVTVRLGSRGDPLSDTLEGVRTTAEILDLGAEPSWRHIAPLNEPRSALTGMNLVLLPDGSVVTMGGGPDPNEPELFDPNTATWTSMARGRYSRAYHSVAVLLPDGRVLSSGGPLGNPERAAEATVEIYSPPYLFRGPRPVIVEAPSELTYGATVTVRSQSASPIEKVVLMGLGANTHSVDFSQRYVDLAFTSQADGLHVATPSNAAEVPPGWYMMFVVDDTGVPSTAAMVRLT